MELLKAYLKERRLTLAAFLLFVGVFAVSFALYGLPLAAVGYPAGLCVLLGACLAAWDYGRAARRHKALKRLREAGEAVLAQARETLREYNSIKEVVARIKEGLKRTGGYCPCRLARTEENKCMCEEFRNQIKDPDFEGYCHCMLYYKEK